jgi:hypothetical protein
VPAIHDLTKHVPQVVPGYLQHKQDSTADTIICAIIETTILWGLPLWSFMPRL